MKSLMKVVVISAAFVCGVVSSARADWTVTTNAQGNVTSVTDGNWVIPASGTREAIELKPPTARGSSTILDLSQPIVDGGAFVSLANQFMGPYASSVSPTRGALTEVKLPETITTLPGGAFWGCTKLWKVTLSTKTTAIGECAFSGCTGLTTIVPFLPDTVTTVGLEAFRDTTKLTQTLTMTEASTVKDLTVSYAASQAGDIATRTPFRDSGLMAIDLSKSHVESINVHFFRMATKLQTVKLPATLRTLSSGIFYDCTSLYEISFLSFPTFGTDAFGNSVAAPNARFTYPANCEGWTNYVSKISGFVKWENAGTGNQSAYLNKFKDGFIPVGYATIHSSDPTKTSPYNPRSKWLVPIPEVTEVELLVSGTPSNIGVVEPGYGDQGKVETLPLTCTAPEHVAAADGVLWRCAGYKLGKLVEGEIVYGAVVAGCTCEFNPAEAGRYYLQWQWEKAAYRVTVGDFPSVMGDLTIAEDHYPNFEGYYPAGGAITLTAAGAAGSPFVRWFGNVPTEQETANPLTLTVDAVKTVTPYFNGKWVLNEQGTSVSDGYWTLPVSGARETLTAGTPAAKGLVPLIDLAKGIEGGGAFTGIVGQFLGCYNASATKLDILAYVNEVRLPETVTVLPGGAFWGCSGLKSITLSTQTTTIGENAFQDCTALTSITPFLPETVTAIVTSAFRGTTNLKLPLVLHAPNLVDIGIDGISDWERGQFYRSGITSVDMSGSGLTNIGQRTFCACSGLKTVVLPEKLERIGMAAFADCSEMTSMTPFLPATLRHVGWAAFRVCGKLRGDLVVRNRRMTAENGSLYTDGTFYQCGLDSADFSNVRAMTVLPNAFLRDCYNLKTVKLPKSLTTYGGDSFFNSYNLMDIRISSPIDLAAVSSPLFGVKPDKRRNAPNCGRIVYQAGDPVMERYVADETAAGNFTAWDPESAAAKTYRNNFPNDNWTPIGYLRLHKNEPNYGQTDKWLVPHNFNAGTMVLVR